MTVTAFYQPEFFDPSMDDVYSFNIESIGSQAIEIYEMDSQGVPHFVPANRYSITFRGRRPIFDGGTVTLSSRSLSDFSGIKVVRNTPIDQTVDWKVVEKFPLVMVEFALDKLTMICQELINRLCEEDENWNYTVDITQEIAFENYSTFPASDVNFALDKLFTICQEIKDNKTPNPDMPFARGN